MCINLSNHFGMDTVNTYQQIDTVTVDSVHVPIVVPKKIILERKIYLLKYDKIFYLDVYYILVKESKID